MVLICKTNGFILAKILTSYSVHTLNNEECYYKWLLTCYLLPSANQSKNFSGYHASSLYKI